MSAGTLSTTKADPNLTPMLDMVFQLITFFMLVINFKTASIDTNIKLPVIGTTRPVAIGGEGDVLVLNVTANGTMNVYGQPQEVETFLKREAQDGLAKARELDPALKPGADLPTTVVIRADATTEFTKVNHILMACQSFGFRKISLKVLGNESAATPSTRR